MWLGLAWVDVPPSPKSQLRLTIVPSVSVEPADENATIRSSLPDVGVPLACAVGGTFGIGLTVMAIVSVSVTPLSSVTVSVAVKVPTAL